MCDDIVNDFFDLSEKYDKNDDLLEKYDKNDEEMKYHVSTIELSEIPLKHIERYIREKKLQNLKNNLAD